MKAEDILNRYHAVKAVLGNKADAWMRLVRIAAAGERGVSHADLFPRTNGWSCLRPYFAAGLLETVEWRDCMNRRRLRIRITPKGLCFLRLDG